MGLLILIKGFFRCWVRHMIAGRGPLEREILSKLRSHPHRRTGLRLFFVTSPLVQAQGGKRAGGSDWYLYVRGLRRILKRYILRCCRARKSLCFQGGDVGTRESCVSFMGGRAGTHHSHCFPTLQHIQKIMYTAHSTTYALRAKASFCTTKRPHQTTKP